MMTKNEIKQTLFHDYDYHYKQSQMYAEGSEDYIREYSYAFEVAMLIHKFGWYDEYWEQREIKLYGHRIS